MTDADAIIDKCLSCAISFPEKEARVEARMKEIKEGLAHWIIKPPQPGLTQSPLPYEPPKWKGYY